MEKSSSWGAVWSLSIGVAGLIIAEFLPVGVLTPMAQELHVTEGMAGQAISSSAVVAMFTSLFISYFTRGFDRRSVLLCLSLFQALSSTMVALAPNYTFLIFGRILLGISVGGFWAMATATALRLVEEKDVPKAISLVFGGSSFATILAAPMGSYLGAILGWRNVFYISAALGLVAFAWQYATIPSLPPRGTTRFRTIYDVLKKPYFATAMFAVVLVFCGRFASFTYMRPFLERTTGISINWISLVLLAFGLAYFIGNGFAPGMIRRNISMAMIVPPFVSAFISVGLILWGSHLTPTLLLIFLWGAVFGVLPPAWSTWVARQAPDHTETAGGIYVASIQFSAALGAMLGGIAFDAIGSEGAFALSGICWLASAGVIYFKVKTS